MSRRPATDKLLLLGILLGSGGIAALLKELPTVTQFLRELRVLDAHTIEKLPETDVASTDRLHAESSPQSGSGAPTLNNISASKTEKDIPEKQTVPVRDSAYSLYFEIDRGAGGALLNRASVRVIGAAHRYLRITAGDDVLVTRPVKCNI